MKSGKPHRAVAIGLVVCSSVATVYVNTTTIHGKEAYDPLQPAIIETSVPGTTVYVDPLAVVVSKASAPKAKKPPATTVAPVVTIAPTTTTDNDRDRDKEEKDDDDDERDD
jgi:hypothetical protein